MLKKDVNIEYKENVKRAKRKYKIRIRAIKRLRNRRIEECYRKGGISRPVDPPKRSVLEEIGNSVTHGIGSLFSIISIIILLGLADSTAERISAIIYSVGQFLMFTSSCLYHAFPHGSVVKRLFRRFDYTGIYLLIGATFAPVLLCLFSNMFGNIFFVIQWLIIITGIVFVCVFGPHRLRKLHIPLYVILGWSALILLPGMFLESPPLALWILAGGVVYSLGIIPYSLNTKVAHFIWHFFVLAGAVVQWVGIFLHIYLK